MRETQKGAERERERERDRQTDRQRDRERDRDRDTNTDTERGRKTDRQRQTWKKDRQQLELVKISKPTVVFFACFFISFIVDKNTIPNITLQLK